MFFCHFLEIPPSHVAYLVFFLPASWDTIDWNQTNYCLGFGVMQWCASWSFKQGKVFWLETLCNVIVIMLSGFLLPFYLLLSAQPKDKILFCQLCLRFQTWMGLVESRVCYSQIENRLGQPHWPYEDACVNWKPMGWEKGMGQSL